jgi:alpha-tubulin suppressor-like RCC1 family protein
MTGCEACGPDRFCGAASRTCISAVVQVTGGASHTCALHKDGTVSCWGLAEALSAGGNTVVAPAKIASVSGARALAAGLQLSCAITAERRVQCWGNESFTLVEEDGTTPVGDVALLALGLGFGCASNPQGTHCWGQNDLGQLGRPLTLQQSSRAVLSMPGVARFLATGQTALTHDGDRRLCGWGHNGTHELTTSDVTRVYTEPQCGELPDVVQLVAGADHACVRHAAGTFACWGERYYGQLGTGGTIADTADIPPYGMQTSLPAAVVDLAAGASHTCALLADGAVTCFGLNSKGQVGPGATTTAEEVRQPAPVTGFAGRVVSLWAGPTAQHTCAILADGSVQCWGSDSDGQLGDGVTSRDPARMSRGPVSVRW